MQILEIYFQIGATLSHNTPHQAGAYVFIMQDLGLQ